MTASVHDLLARRGRRHEPAMTFETDDVDALCFAAACIDELRETARSALLIDTETLQLLLDQAAEIIRACTRLHTTERHEIR